MRKKIIVLFISIIIYHPKIVSETYQDVFNRWKNALCEQKTPETILNFKKMVNSISEYNVSGRQTCIDVMHAVVDDFNKKNPKEYVLEKCKEYVEEFKNTVIEACNYSTSKK